MVSNSLTDDDSFDQELPKVNSSSSSRHDNEESMDKRTSIVGESPFMGRLVGDRDEDCSELDVAQREDERKEAIRKRLVMWRGQREQIEKRMQELKKAEELFDLETKVDFHNEERDDDNIQSTCRDLLPGIDENRSASFSEEAVQQETYLKQNRDIFDEVSTTNNTIPDSAKESHVENTSITLRQNTDREFEDANEVSKPKNSYESVRENNDQIKTSRKSNEFAVAKDEYLRAKKDSESLYSNHTVPKQDRDQPRTETNMKVKTNIGSFTETVYKSPRSIDRKKKLVSWKQHKQGTETNNTHEEHLQVTNQLPSNLRRRESERQMVKENKESLRKGIDNNPPKVDNQPKLKQNPKINASIRPNAEAKYDTPRSIDRKKKIVQWKKDMEEVENALESSATIISTSKSSNHFTFDKESIDSVDQKKLNSLKINLHSSTTGIPSRKATSSNTIPAVPERRKFSYIEVKSKLYSPTTASTARTSLIARERESRMASKLSAQPKSNGPRVPSRLYSPTAASLARTTSLARYKASKEHSDTSEVLLLDRMKRTPPKPPMSPKSFGRQTNTQLSSSSKTNQLRATPSSRRSSADRQSPKTLTKTRVNMRSPNSSLLKKNARIPYDEASNADLPEKEMENTTNESNKQTILSLLSSDDSEEEILLNAYQTSNIDVCSHPVNKKSYEVYSDGNATENGTETETKPLQIGHNDSLKETENHHADKTQSEKELKDELKDAPNRIEDIVCSLTKYCNFENLWKDFIRNPCLPSSQNTDGTDLKSNNKNNSESSGEKTYDHNIKNFLLEWPKDAMEKNKVAKELIDEACKTNDVEKIAQICHKFREEFVAARFYIGVLLMEKEELERKLGVMTENMEDNVNEHRMTLSENKALKEQILALHDQLITNDKRTQNSMVELEKEMSETLNYALLKAKGLQKELEKSNLQNRMLEVKIRKVNNQEGRLF